jgi:hypothetical protein
MTTTDRCPGVAEYGHGMNLTTVHSSSCCQAAMDPPPDDEEEEEGP